MNCVLDTTLLSLHCPDNSRCSTLWSDRRSQRANQATTCIASRSIDSAYRIHHRKLWLATSTLPSCRTPVMSPWPRYIEREVRSESGIVDAQVQVLADSTEPIVVFPETVQEMGCPLSFRSRYIKHCVGMETCISCTYRAVDLQSVTVFLRFLLQERSLVFPAPGWQAGLDLALPVFVGCNTWCPVP